MGFVWITSKARCVTISGADRKGKYRYRHFARPPPIQATLRKLFSEVSSATSLPGAPVQYLYLLHPLDRNGRAYSVGAPREKRPSVMGTPARGSGPPRPSPPRPATPLSTPSVECPSTCLLESAGQALDFYGSASIGTRNVATLFSSKM